MLIRQASRSALGLRMFRTSAPCQLEDVSTQLRHYDVCLIDVTHELLCTSIAEELGRPYLEPATAADITWPVEGKYIGEGHRQLLNMVVTRNTKRVFVSFVLDSGAPSTYLAPAACQALGLTDEVPFSFTVNVHGVSLAARATPTSKKHCHFVGVNVLGMDFVWLTGATVLPDIANNRFHLIKDPDRSALVRVHGNLVSVRVSILFMRLITPSYAIHCIPSIVQAAAASKIEEEKGELK